MGELSVVEMFNVAVRIWGPAPGSKMGVGFNWKYVLL